MGTQRARFEAWLSRWRGVRTPQEEAALLEVASACDAAIESGKLSAEGLQVVTDAASSSRALLWMNATELLADLATRWTSGADAIRAMFRSRQSHVRFASLCCLTRKSPPNLLDELLCGGLHDKSSRVRWKAAQKIGDFDKKELLQQLQAALDRETNTKARRGIELSLRLLRDGHIVEPASPSGFYVTVRTKNGISSGYVTEEAMRDKGITAVAAELRSASESRLRNYKSL